MSALAKKLLIKPNTKWLFYDVPAECMQQLQPLPDGLKAITTVDTGVDGILFFSTKRARLIEQLTALTSIIKDETVVWVCYPKKSSGMDTDLAMMQWDMLPQFGLDAVANAAFNDTWTCVRLRHLGLRKSSGMALADIKQNEYGEYIDVDNKQIKLPPQIAGALQHSPQAVSFYQGLSYSNKKEYVLWILTAKQEKTREERLVKLVEKLNAGKKNPSEK
jgi:hypothetical protein